METQLNATEQDISKVVAEICEAKEELKKCAESDKIIHFRDEIKWLSKREDHLRIKEEQLREKEKILLEQLQPKGISSSQYIPRENNCFVMCFFLRIYILLLYIHCINNIDYFYTIT